MTQTARQESLVSSVDLDEELESPLFEDSSLRELSESANAWQGLGRTENEEGEHVIPVDQAQTIAAAKRLDNLNGDLDLVLIDTGIFSVLNADTKEEAEERIARNKERHREKKDYLTTLADRADVDVEIRNAEEYWQNEDFWNKIDWWMGEVSTTDSEGYGFEDMIELEQRTSSHGDLSAEELINILNKTYDLDLDRSGIEEISNAYSDQLNRDLGASQLYFLAELALGAHLDETEDRSIKIGQRSENSYDQHGKPDHIHLTQPVSLSSSEQNPNTVDPYTVTGDEDPEKRIYADDSRQEVREKVNNASASYAVTDSSLGEVMNGIVGLTAYAVEISDDSLSVRNAELETAEDVLNYAGESDDSDLSEEYLEGNPNHLTNEASDEVGDLIYENLTNCSD